MQLKMREMFWKSQLVQSLQLCHIFSGETSWAIPCYVTEKNIRELTQNRAKLIISIYHQILKFTLTSRHLFQIEEQIFLLSTT